MKRLWIVVALRVAKSTLRIPGKIDNHHSAGRNWRYRFPTNAVVALTRGKIDDAYSRHNHHSVGQK
jgi:hypothetical protein